MHIEHADAPVYHHGIVTDTVTPEMQTPYLPTNIETRPVVVKTPYLPTNIETRPVVVNPTSPIQYSQNNQPVLVQTPQGSAIVPTQTQPVQQPQPLIIQSNLPQDQKAYKSGSEPMFNNPFSGLIQAVASKVSASKATETTQTAQAAAPTLSTGFTPLILAAVAIGIIIYIFKR